MLFGTIENRGCHRHTRGQVLRQMEHLAIAKGFEVFFGGDVTRLVVNLLKELAHFSNGTLLTQHLVDLHSQTFGGHTQVHFQYLAHVHTRGNAEWVENNIHWLAIFVVGHVLYRHDYRDNTLVTVTTG